MLNALKIGMKKVRNKSCGDPEHHVPSGWKSESGGDSPAAARR